MELLEWLKALPWIVTVRESAWLYPTVETIHGLGMGLLVGTVTVLDLRLLGMLTPIPLPSLRKLGVLIWAGFFMNAASGVVMFMSDGPRLVTNWIFLVKMALIVTGVALILRLQRVVVANEGGWLKESLIPLDARVLSCASLFVWYAAIVAGRVTAFLGDQ